MLELKVQHRNKQYWSIVFGDQECLWRPWDGKHRSTWFPWEGFTRILCKVCSELGMLNAWKSVYKPELLIHMLNTMHLQMFWKKDLKESEQNCLQPKPYWACMRREVYSKFSTLSFCFGLIFISKEKLLETLILTFSLRNLGCLMLSAVEVFSFLKLWNSKYQDKLYVVWQKINMLTLLNLFL